MVAMPLPLLLLPPLRPPPRASARWRLMLVLVAGRAGGSG